MATTTIIKEILLRSTVFIKQQDRSSCIIRNCLSKYLDVADWSINYHINDYLLVTYLFIWDIQVGCPTCLYGLLLNCWRRRLHPPARIFFLEAEHYVIACRGKKGGGSITLTVSSPETVEVQTCFSFPIILSGINHLLK
jgi:hypothetical protein